jgi:biotin operon repressor
MNTNPELTLFISHASIDAALAKAVVEVFEKATKLPARQIRCTSVAGYCLPVGSDTDEQLRREIFVARAFIGVRTPSSARSAYVLFELGARWGAKHHLAPVFGRGADAASISGPLSGLNALNLADRNQVLQLVQDVAEYLELPLEPLASFQGAVDAVVVQAKSVAEAPHFDSATATLPMLEDEQIKALQFLAQDTEQRTAAQVAQHLGVSEQKVKYHLDELERQSMVGYNISRDKPTMYYLRHSGRSALVDRNLL